MARKSSYCKSGNKNINWHPTKVFLEDFWAIIFQKLCMNFLGLAPLHCKSLNHPEQSVSLFILGQNLFNPRTFKKKWPGILWKKHPASCRTWSARRRLPSTSMPENCTGIGHPLCSPKTASAPKSVPQLAVLK